METPPPIFPVEIWLMIIGHLHDEESVQHISRLARTSKWFHHHINDSLYPIMRLSHRWAASDFAYAMITTPKLKFVARTEFKALIRELRHHDDMGFQDFDFNSSLFYEELQTMENLQTLIMRPKWRKRGFSQEKVWTDLVYDICLRPTARDWKMDILNFLEEMIEDGISNVLRDPFGSCYSPILNGIPSEKEVRTQMTRFCGGRLEGKPVSLSSCHVGTDSLQKKWDPITTFFNWSIFYLSQIKTLCITGANFDAFDHHLPPGAGSMTALQELTVLNCRISSVDLTDMVKCALWLKRLTVRGPGCFLARDMVADEYMDLSRALAQHHSKSLESLDLDIYWGTEFGLMLRELKSLKSLTVTMDTLLGVGLEDPALTIADTLPESLETLTVRHERKLLLPFKQVREAINSGRLPNLRTMSFHIPENIKAHPTSSELHTEAESWVQRFEQVNVELQVCLVLYLLGMGKYNACPCECLHVYHRFPFHERLQTLDWESDDDNQAEEDMEEESEEDVNMDEGSIGEESLKEDDLVEDELDDHELDEDELDDHELDEEDLGEDNLDDNDLGNDDLDDADQEGEENGSNGGDSDRSTDLLADLDDKPYLWDLPWRRE